MKKLILGLSIMTLSPFLVILGAYILNSLKVQEGAFEFSCIIGSVTICFNYLFAAGLVIQGHSDMKTFKDKDKD